LLDLAQAARAYRVRAFFVSRLSGPC
jgi:hypothetical protein